MILTVRSPGGAVSFLDSVNDAELRSLLIHAYDHFKMYGDHFSNCGVTRDAILRGDITAVFAKLTPIGKKDYARLQTESFLAQSHASFVIDPSSGSTGTPTLKFTSPADDSAEAAAIRIAFERLGIGSHTRCACLDIGSSQIYLFYMNVLREFGVRDPMFFKLTNDSDRTAQLLRAYDPDLLISIPSVLKRVLRAFEAAHGTHKGTGRRVVYIGEPMEHALRTELLSVFGADCYSFYGTTEIGSICMECSTHTGMHIPLQLFVATISPWPDSLEDCEISPLRYRGLIAWTPLGIRGQPAVKYSVNDLVEIDLNPCECGNEDPRLIFIHRVDDAFFLYGLTLTYQFFLDTIEDVLDQSVELEIRIGHTKRENETFDLIILVMDEAHRNSESALRSALVGTHPVSELVASKFLELWFEFLPPGQLVNRKVRKVVRINT